MVGVDEHVWRHTHRGDTCVTVIIDLTPVRAGTGSARLLDMIEAHRTPGTSRGRELMQAVIDALGTGVPAALTEPRRLGRTLTRRAADVPAHFDRPRTSNGQTEAINDRLEHLPGAALGFRNLTTTSPDHCSRPADSDRSHTPDSEQPSNPITIHSQCSFAPDELHGRFGAPA